MLEILDALGGGFDSVRNQTSTFQEACDELSIEHIRLEKLADDIETHLRPFNMLEEITRRLNAPGTDFVTQEGFKQMLSTLDQCIEYCNMHVSFRLFDFQRSIYHADTVSSPNLKELIFTRCVSDNA